MIESVWIGNKNNLLKSPAEEIARTLEGSRIEGVRRVGKHIVIDLQRNHAGRRRVAQLRKRSGSFIWG